jgi:hypothetical protein
MPVKSLLLSVLRGGSGEEGKGHCG